MILSEIVHFRMKLPNMVRKPRDFHEDMLPRKVSLLLLKVVVQLIDLLHDSLQEKGECVWVYVCGCVGVPVGVSSQTSSIA